MGRWMPVAFNPKSLGETARSISNARMSMKSSALILQRKIYLEHNVDGYDQNTHSTSENRKPIQARGPPMNVKMFAQTPGTEEAAFGIFSQRSGLEKKGRITN
jgi:hypothetical protein